MIEAFGLLAIWNLESARVLISSVKGAELMAALAAVAASGVIGSLLARVHHLLVWWLPGYGRDYTQLQEVLEPVPAAGEHGHSDTLKRSLAKRLAVLGTAERERRRSAWRVVHAAWHQKLGMSQGVTEDAQSLTDLAQSEGAAHVGVFLLGPLFLAAAWYGSWPSSTLAYIAWAAVWVVLVLLHGQSYTETRDHSECFDSMVIRDRIRMIVEYVQIAHPNTPRARAILDLLRSGASGLTEGQAVPPTVPEIAEKVAVDKPKEA